MKKLTVFIIAGGKPNANKERWINDIGLWWYWCLVLSGFSPVHADDIFDNPADVIAEAVVSKTCYEFMEMPKK